MARHKNVDWNLPEGGRGGTTHNYQSIHAALLMDLRDELKEMNRLLRNLNSIFNCSNFLSIPRVIAEIRRNTAKPRRKKAAKK